MRLCLPDVGDLLYISRLYLRNLPCPCIGLINQIVDKKRAVDSLSASRCIRNRNRNAIKR